MSMGGPWGESVRKALNSGEDRNAREREAGTERSALDKAELRELELSGVYGVAPEVPQRPSAIRRIVDRLIRR